MGHQTLINWDELIPIPSLYLRLHLPQNLQTSGIPKFLCGKKTIRLWPWIWNFISTPISQSAVASDALQDSTSPNVPWTLRSLSVHLSFYPSTYPFSDFLAKFGGSTAQFIAAVILVNEATSPRVYIPLGLLAFILGIVEGGLGLLRRWCRYRRATAQIEILFLFLNTSIPRLGELSWQYVVFGFLGVIALIKRGKDKNLLGEQWSLIVALLTLKNRSQRPHYEIR